MKNTRKTFTRLFIAAALISACVAAGARAQNREEHFISARAGGVNFVSGDVTARRAGEKEWQRLSVKDNLRSGDAVRAGGRVELLLNPGSYLRAGEGAEFELTSSSLEDLQLTLKSGGIVIEATGYDGLDLSIVIITPRSRVRIIRSGLYRLNVLPSGATEVAVQHGRAIVGGSSETLIKGGKVARGGAGGVEIVKFDKKNRDALDLWSRERGHELARANAKLANRNTNALLAQTNFDSMFSNRYSSGYWFWSSGIDCYTFLPFSGGYRSPYGFWYGSSFNPFGYLGYPCRTCGPQDFRPSGNGPPNASPVVTYNPGGTNPGSPNPGGTNPVGRNPMPDPQPSPIERNERPMRERPIETVSPPL